MMAGLSLRKVSTAPRDATPGRLNSGFITGLSNFCRMSTTPKSTRSFPRAPVITHRPIR